MNVYDSQRMSDALAAEGYQTTERPEEADLVLLNGWLVPANWWRRMRPNAVSPGLLLTGIAAMRR